jgi:hypothetical protein
MRTYGFTTADVTTTTAGVVAPGVQLTVWDAETGGNQVLDLLDADGNPLPGYVLSGANGAYGWKHDGTFDRLWVSADNGVTRWATEAHEALEDKLDTETANSTFGTLAQQEANTTDILGRVRVPDAAEQVVYVTVRGDDSNDGLTLKTAKATIAAALTALGGNPGVIQLGAGNLSTSATHTLPSGTEVRGAGRGLSTLTYTGTGTLFQGISGTRTYNQVIRDLNIVGPSKTSTAVALDLVDVSQFRLEGFVISAFSVGVKHGSTIVGGALYNRFREGFLTGCGTGAKYTGTGSNGSSWQSVKFGACTIAVDVLDSNQNAFVACQFEANTIGVQFDASAAGGADNNAVVACRFEGNSQAWKVLNSTVRGTAILFPAVFGTYAFTDAGVATQHLLGLAGAWTSSSAVAATTGAWRFSRYGNGGSETPALVIADTVTTSGTPVTIQAETERSAGYFFRGKRGGTTYFDVRADGVISGGASTTAARPTGTLRAGAQWFDSTLGKPIWWNGTGWVDATGATV